MNEPQDPNRTVDVPSASADTLEAGLAAGFGRAELPSSTLSDPLPPPHQAGGLPVVPGYRVLREIARGGMGRVLAAYDLGLDREVALKILLPGAHADRFVRESKITARLPHPGIPPVHALGTLVDGSPFLAMKLIAGQTLAEEMKTADRPRLLQAFTQVCQAVGFAHSRGIIHRDLKPANVMVGAFGEVQVMDWGLAKIQRDEGGGMRDERESSDSSVSSLLPHPSSLQTRAGQVMGTPAYMAPEQARAEETDARADVFALGGILCALLTGQPPYSGKTAHEVIRRAGATDLAEAYTRLDGCGADAELVSLCRRCLSPAPADRPAHGQAVADGMMAYLGGVQEKLRKAELAGVEERARRRLTTVVAASLLALSIAGGLGFTYWLHQRQAGAARGALALKEATLLRDQALDRPEDPARWEAALESLKRAETALAEGGDPDARQDLATLDAEVRTGAQAAQRDHVLLGQLIDIRSAKADDLNGSATDAAYAEAFRAAGLGIDGDDPKAAAARIASRPEPVRVALVAALDHWTAVRKGRKAGGEAWPRLVAVARAADPDPDRDALRAALAVEDKARRLEQIRPLVARAAAPAWSPASLVLLANTLADAGDAEAGVRVLRRASGVYPTDAWVHYVLGQLLERTTPARRDEAIEAYAAARAVRPELAHELAHALEHRGRNEEAEAVFRDLVARRPLDGRHLGCLGQHLQSRGRNAEASPFLERAIAAGREAIGLRPDDAIAHANLVLALNANGQYEEASAIARKAIALDPQDAVTHHNLGVALQNRGLLDEAIASYRAAIAVDPKYAGAHSGLGNALKKKGRVDEAIDCLRKAIALDPKDPAAHNGLGLVLEGKGQLDETIACYQKAVEVDPSYAPAHLNLGNALKGKGRMDEAIACYRKAIEVDPNYAAAHNGLGNGLSGKGRLDEAIACYKKALALDPKNVEAHSNLGVARLTKGQLNEGIACFRTAIALDPKLAAAHMNLGEALRRNGRVDEAIACLEKALALDPKVATAHLNLGKSLEDKGQVEQAIACYQRAIVLDPKLAKGHTALGVVLMKQGQLDEAIACHLKAIALDSKDAEAHDNLGYALSGKGQMNAAIACFKKAIALDPTNAMAHNNLGSTLARMGQTDEGIVYLHKAIALDPKNAMAHDNLGHALDIKGQVDAAIACYKKAIEVDPKYASAHHNLGAILCNVKQEYEGAIACFRQAIALDPKSAKSHFCLGNALSAKGRMDEAIACYQKAIVLDPKNARAHQNLGALFCDHLRNYDAAIASFRQAITLDPKYALAHFNLGNALAGKGHVDEAIACWRKAIEIDPKFPQAANVHYVLGCALSDRGRADEAIACYKRAIAIDPNHAEAHCNLGKALGSQGHFAESLAAYKRGHELGTKRPGWPYPSAEWVRQAKRLAALEARLPEVLKGELQPKGTVRLEFVGICQAKQLHHAAARLSSDALAANPQLADDLQKGYRYNAACSAALAAVGQGKDAIKPDDKERTRLRRQALDWLRADLAGYTKLWESDPVARSFVRDQMKHWQEDTDLAGVRGEAALAKLSAAEHAMFTKLWADVAALMKKSGSPAQKESK
jgi:tetratricopeptide (TPR) repeat protein